LRHVCIHVKIGQKLAFLFKIPSIIVDLMSVIRTKLSIDVQFYTQIDNYGHDVDNYYLSTVFTELYVQEQLEGRDIARRF